MVGGGWHSIVSKWKDPGAAKAKANRDKNEMKYDDVEMPEPEYIVKHPNLPNRAQRRRGGFINRHKVGVVRAIRKV